eukprot:768795-Hanusia_phi.AAC.3
MLIIYSQLDFLILSVAIKLFKHTKGPLLYNLVVSLPEPRQHVSPGPWDGMSAMHLKQAILDIMFSAACLIRFCATGWYEFTTRTGLTSTKRCLEQENEQHLMIKNPRKLGCQDWK